MTKPKPGPLTEAFVEWLSSARKGETFRYFRGDLQRVLLTAEQRQTSAERKARAEKRVQIRAEALKAGVKPKFPSLVDEFADIKPDAAALAEIVRENELKGLISVRQIVQRKHDSIYEATCMIQRNGLRAVRLREWNIRE